MAYITVVDPGETCCRIPNDQALVTADNGYLASSMTLDTGCGGKDCPWHLEASDGKHLNISIYDFGLRK